jgi:uncharacterized cupin superfamily protein
VHLHGWERIGQLRTFIPAIGKEVPGKGFLLEALGLTGMEVSYSAIPPGKQTPFYHKHRKNEELYIVISGHGQMQVDGVVTDIGPGSAVRVAPEGSRALRCTGTDVLIYLVIQAEAGSYTTPGGITDGELVPGPVTWPDTP